jgi:hypothetical protein
VGPLIVSLLLANTYVNQDAPVWGPAEHVRIIQAPRKRGRPRVLPFPLVLDLPLLDVPFNFSNGYNWPSPIQAVAVTTDVYDLLHWAIGLGLNPWGDDKLKAALGVTAISALDTLTFLVAGPASSAWTHEEFHVAVLTTQGVPSRNPLSRGFALPLFAPASIEVDSNDVETFKQSAPAAFSYVNVAGFQAHAMLAQRFERNLFFEDQPVLSNFIIGLNHLLPVIYNAICLGTGEGDCAIQVRHLFAPQETTAFREYTDQERAYLSRQLGFSLLNFVDPFLFTIRGIELPNGLVFNSAVRHVPTPYGQEIRLDGFMTTGSNRGHLGMRVSLHSGFNQAAWCPGISFEVQGAAEWFRASISGSLWLQPAGQSFTSPVLQAGGHGAMRFGYMFLEGRVGPWIEGEIKSAGWLLGNPYLDWKASFRAGMTVAI